MLSYTCPKGRNKKRKEDTGQNEIREDYRDSNTCCCIITCAFYHIKNSYCYTKIAITCNFDIDSSSYSEKYIETKIIKKTQVVEFNNLCFLQSKIANTNVSYFEGSINN